MVILSQAIPALPVRDAAASAGFYRERLGFDETDFGTREFAALDPDGNLVTFFERVPE